MTGQIPEDELEIELRPAPEVGRRMILLSALLERTATRDDARVAADEKDAAAFDLREWLRHEGLWPLLSPEEAELLASDESPRMLPEQLAEGFMAEALAALAWSAGMVNGLDATRPADLGPLIPAIPHPWDSTTTWLAALSLRPFGAVAEQRERCELWAWRFAIERDLTGPDPIERAELAGILRETEGAGTAAGLLPAGGFRVNGGSISALDAPTRDALAEANLSRLYALNWVCGFGASWEDVPLDI
ncbi:MAG: DUF4272 domain-containing protein [Thermomicrobiales bacterium]